MTDREKVVKGLECCLGDTRSDLPNLCTICPYAKGSYATQNCCMQLREDAITLLKEQEPVKQPTDDSFAHMAWWKGEKKNVYVDEVVNRMVYNPYVDETTIYYKDGQIEVKAGRPIYAKSGKEYPCEIDTGIR